MLAMRPNPHGPMRTLALLLIFLPAVAWSQTAPAPPSPSQSEPPAPPPSAPTSIGRPHTCPGSIYYPEIEAHHAIQGETGVSFIITTDGSLKNLAVFKTSGDDGLDLAALNCALQWRYKPAMQFGVPVEVPWKAKVRWRVSDGVSWPPQPTGAPHVCTEARSNPGRTTPPDPAVLLVNTNADGTVASASVEEPSGDKIFDAYAVDCAKHWTYAAPLVEGKPADSQTVAIVTWHGAPLQPDQPPVPVNNPPCNTHPDWAADAPAKPTVSFVVATDGSVGAVKVFSTSRNDAYDEYAVECVSHWTFRPGLHFGHPKNTRQWVTIE